MIDETSITMDGRWSLRGIVVFVFIITGTRGMCVRNTLLTLSPAVELLKITSPAAEETEEEWSGGGRGAEAAFKTTTTTTCWSTPQRQLELPS